MRKQTQILILFMTTLNQEARGSCRLKIGYREITLQAFDNVEHVFKII